MYRIITENGEEIKRFDNEVSAERYYDMMNGICLDDDDNELYIYIEKIA